MIERTTYKLKGTLRIDFETDRARLDSFPALESDWNKLLHRLTKADEPLRYHDGDGEEDMLYPLPGEPRTDRICRYYPQEAVELW